MDTFGAASHNEVLQLVIQIGVLLASARILGAVARRLGQPSVIGEILAGILLGPSMLSGWVPAVGEWVLPQTEVQGHLLEVVALIGVMFLMVVTGLETDLGLIRRRIRVASGVALGGLIVPFATGALLGANIPRDLLGDPSRRPVFVLFIATALSISAIPVLAKVLIDLGLMRREIGQTMLAAGMIDDITGWTLLGLVTALASADAASPVTVLGTVGTVVIFVAVSATVGAWLTRRGLLLVQGLLRGEGMALTLIVVTAFAWGALSQWLHLEPLIGAFAIGILFGRFPTLPADAAATLETMALHVFAPIFFAVAGLKVDIGAVLEPRLLGLALLVIAVATFGKVAGAYVGARFLSGQDHWYALAFGAGLNARGALEILIASIGLSLGILSVEMFSIIVVMAVVTSLMAPFGLRYCLARVVPAADEEHRIAKERALRSTFTAGIRRILVPVRPRSDVAGTQVIEAFISRRLAEAHGAATTLIAVPTDSTKGLATEYLSRLRALFTGDATTKVIPSDKPREVILREAEHGYDLLMVGTATMSTERGTLFGPLVDEIVRYAPCPTIVVRGEPVVDAWRPRRILVPTNGTPSSRRALDLAFTLAEDDAQVEAIHVIPAAAVTTYRDFATDITSEIRAVATSLEHDVATRVIEASGVEEAVLAEAETWGADLIVLGTGVRAGSNRLYLGPSVEHLARNAPCPVVIVNG